MSFPYQSAPVMVDSVFCAATLPFRSAMLLLGPRPAAPFRKVAVKEPDQRALLGGMRVLVRPGDMALRELDGLAFIDVACHYQRVHVRRPADGRCVPQLGGNEAHRRH